MHCSCTTETSKADVKIGSYTIFSLLPISERLSLSFFLSVLQMIRLTNKDFYAIVFLRDVKTEMRSHSSVHVT